MKTWLGAIVVATVVGAGSLAWAGNCPVLIKLAREALEQYRKSPMPAPVKDATVAAVEANLHGGRRPAVRPGRLGRRG